MSKTSSRVVTEQVISTLPVHCRSFYLYLKVTTGLSDEKLQSIIIRVGLDTLAFLILKRKKRNGKFGV